MSTTTTARAVAARRSATQRPRAAFATIFIAATVLLSACASSSPNASGSASTAATTTPVAATGALLAAAHTSLGTVLVDGKGMAVYVFGADSPGTSTCTGVCVQYWPPVPAPATLPASVTGVSGALGEITRSDGSKQLTVAGWPVYTYAADTTPGVASGEGKNLSGGQWWVVAPDGTAVKSAPGASSTPSTSTAPSPSVSKSTGGGWA